MRGYIGSVLRLLVYVIFLAAALYAFFWLIDQRGRGAGGDPEPRRRTPKDPGTPGPLGPDDDEDFLRELERWRRHGS